MSDHTIDDAPCGYLAIDDQGWIIRANTTLADWLGKHPDDLVRQPVTSIFALASSVVLETSLLPLLRLQRQVSGVSLDLIASDKSKIPAIMSADCLGDDADRILRLVLLKAAARRDYEQDLIKARAKAEADLSAEQRQGRFREQFVAILGHDLRNPLAAISSGLRVLSRAQDEDRKAEVTGLMQGSVQRMSHLIDNVLDFARSRLGGDLDLNLENGNLDGAIRQAVDELIVSSPDRDVNVEISIQHEVSCDVWRIGQLVSNLVGNALTHGDDDKPIMIVARTSGPGALEISVSNYGTPIPASQQETLFEPFERNGKEGREGLGLGLHISSVIAEAHGGRLNVTSDEMTCFTFRMPAGEGQS